MSTHEALQRKLQLKDGSRLWLWPDDAPAPPELAETDGVAHAALPDADVAVLVTADRAAVEAVLSAHLEQLAPLRAVWILYAKGNRTDINRDSLWIQLAEHGWRAVSQVSFDDERSALRVRPLRPGETPRTG